MPNNEKDFNVIKKKIQYRAWHRGMLELDLVLGKFADSNIDKLTSVELKSFANILKLNENILIIICMTDGPLPEYLSESEKKLCHNIRKASLTLIK